MRKLATTLSADDVEFEAVFVGSEAQQIAIRAAMISGAQGHYGITYAPKGSYTTGTISRFIAVVSSYGRMAPIDDKVAIKFTLAIHDAVTEAALS